ncbi:hypothetical protein FisN_17Lu199 [Fistulifera solaris]|uniref:Uncharacterized protein n=1 Tax=Fistulifera solaris TaxID=1519565 RepID=A0A1Z5JD55_FISSO|nr:hypothetical protein FisN_17Lu199 [Fistulifera solaris]|eukprot:GAX11899.1 hypothetical protein FisN_17Lu199 [Fistulifera solaris]
MRAIFLCATVSFFPRPWPLYLSRFSVPVLCQVSFLILKAKRRASIKSYGVKALMGNGKSHWVTRHMANGTVPYRTW